MNSKHAVLNTNIEKWNHNTVGLYLEKWGEIEYLQMKLIYFLIEKSEYKNIYKKYILKTNEDNYYS